jgi:hypothetical protein
MSTATTAGARSTSFKCGGSGGDGCGAPLEIPKNSKGRVVCQYCGRDNVIEGITKNAEMAKKEDINSGIPLFAPAAVLHRRIVAFLTESPSMPIDVLQEGEVVREEHHCVPAYLYYCEGRAEYSYEIGNQRERQRAVQSGDSIVYRTEQYIEWSHMSGSSSASSTVFTAGNRETVQQVQKLYMLLSPGALIDYDELDFPHDVITYDYNLPQAAAFNEYVKPYMASVLQKRSQEALKGKQTRNLSMNGDPNIKREGDITRVFLGLYRLVFKYRDKEYSIWVTGDGARAYHEGMPIDQSRAEALSRKHQAFEAAKSAVPLPKTGLWSFLIALSIIGGLILAFGVWFPLILIGIAGWIVSGIKRKNVKKPYDNRIREITDNYNKDVAAFNAEVQNAIARFKSAKQPLRGVYENELAGDASAF